jgi:purine-nucleoside phosphorylase
MTVGSLAESLKEKETFPYGEVPNFPVSTVQGHAGQLVFGLLDDVPVMCMQGRFHYFEGNPICKVDFGVFSNSFVIIYCLNFAHCLVFEV